MICNNSQNIKCLFGFHDLKHVKDSVEDDSEWCCAKCGLLFCIFDNSFYEFDNSIECSSEFNNGHYTFIKNKRRIVFSNHPLSENEAEQLDDETDEIIRKRR